MVNIKPAAAPWQSQTHSYDTLDRVTAAIGDFGFLDFTYDKTGNRLTRTHNGSQSVYNYAPGTSRLERITTGGQTITLTQDGHGNTTSAGSRRYTYDQANQLVRVDDTDLVAQYAYNGLGQRVVKTVNGQSTYYHYDLAGHLIAETPAGGLVNAGIEHIYKGNGLLSQVDVKTGAIYGYHTNYLGAVHQPTNSNGTIVWEAVYQPFGETVINAGSTVVNNFRMPGQYFDAETGLHYNYFRYYDAATGRYLTPDPIGLEGGINLYGYVENEPMGRTDPYGLDSTGKIEIGGKLYKFIPGDHHGVNPPETHVHDRETGNKVGVETGTIYDRKGKNIVGRLKAKQLAKLQKVLKAAGYLATAVTILEIYDAMTAKDAEAFDNFLNYISILPPDLQAEALQNALNRRPDLFEETIDEPCR